jgi:hypothetical protein
MVMTRMTTLVMTLMSLRKAMKTPTLGTLTTGFRSPRPSHLPRHQQLCSLRSQYPHLYVELHPQTSCFITES